MIDKNKKLKFLYYMANMMQLKIYIEIFKEKI
jgi:hypothetical protein